jgi:molybdenum cofactor cytidylyltransferase
VISGVVLAAGTSSRLGRPKQLLELDGRPLLQHVVDAVAAAGVDEVVVVLGHAADQIGAAITFPDRARTVVNPDYRSGQASSLATGLEAVGPDPEAVVIVLGDQPRLDPQRIRRVLDAWTAADAAVARALWEGVPGHPVVIGRSQLDLFRTIEGDKGGRDVIAGMTGVLEVEMGEAAPIDVDTWDDFGALEST